MKDIIIFNKDLAKKYDINQAILIHHLCHWISINKHENRNFNDGYIWTYNSVKAFSEVLDFMSIKQIEYTLKKLEDNNIIKSGNYNKRAADRTKWYTVIDSEVLKLYGISQNSEMDSPKSSNDVTKISEALPNSNSNSNQQKEKINKKEIGKRLETIAYGEFENVWLKESEVEKACKQFKKSNVLERIERLSGYIENHSVKYKNHYAALLNWLRNDKERNPDKYKIERSFWDK